MVSRRTVTWLAILAFPLLLAGCTSETTSSGGKNTTPGGKKTAGNGQDGVEEDIKQEKPELTRGKKKPAEDDTLLLFYGDDPNTLNPITSNDTVSNAFQRQVIEGMAEQSYHNPDEFLPALAESWEFDEETLTYKIKLRKGVYWHPMALPNGKKLPRTEFTSADVKFTFDCILNENIEAASLRSYYVDPEAKQESEKYKIKVTVIDDYTVKVRWTKPYFQALEFTMGIGIMPRHVYGVDENGEPITLDYRNSQEFADAFNNHWANTRMCGTGPMIFKEWKKDREVTLVRNPDYWGNPFYFKRIVYQNIANPNTALQKVLQNELDWASIPQKDHYVQNQEHENVVAGKVNLVAFDYPGYRYLGYNMRRDLFKDKRVRWAVSHAVPVDDIIDKVWYKLATRITGPFLPGSSADNPNIKPVEYNLDRARKLLDEAGWKDTNNDGVRDKVVEGKNVEAKFEVIIFAESPQYRQLAEIIREDLRKIGIDMKITPTKWALMLEKLNSKEFDACILGWGLSWKGDPFQLWHGSQADVPDSSNHIGYQNGEVDKLIEKLRETMDPEKQKAIYHQIHQHIYDDQPYCFLFQEKATAGHHSRLQNIQFYKIRPGFDTREWWATEPRRLAQ